MQEAEQKFQKMLAFLISQYFQESYSVPPLHNDQSSILDTSTEFLRESKRHSQNMLDSPFSQNQVSHTSLREFERHPSFWPRFHCSR